MSKFNVLLTVLVCLFVLGAGSLAQAQIAEAKRPTTAPEISGPMSCPKGQTLEGRECVLVYNPQTGDCMTTVGKSKGWVPVDECPVPVNTPDPTPTNIPTTASPVPGTSATPTSGEACPTISVTGYVTNEIVFSTVYDLTSPAGQVLSFGQLEVNDVIVDKVVFVSSSALILEEMSTSDTVTMFTWEQTGVNHFEELRYNDGTPWGCKIRFLFGSLAP